MSTNSNNGSATLNGTNKKGVKYTEIQKVIDDNEKLKANADTFPYVQHMNPPMDKKAEVTSEPPAPVILPVPTLQSQRDKNEKLNLLFEKEAKYATSKKELERFKIATDESTNILDLTDGKGAKFRTCNPVVIKNVLNEIMKELTTKQEQTANEIIALG
ncbi:MAG: hypothetical protein JWO03_2858 [Bacteroidetes bacterium]|nr:hypothetical protein [Bacteroidota bacterium]